MKGKVVANDLRVLCPIQQVKQHEEARLKSDIAVAHRALDLFCNSRMNDAEALLLKGHKKTLYSTHGYSVLLTFRALLTFKPDEIDIAVMALETTIKVASRYRRSRGTMISDIILGGPSELVVAEANLLLFMLVFIQRSNQPLIKAALYVKRCQTLYSAIRKFVVAIEKESENGIDITGYNIDVDFYSGITFGPAILAIGISYINMLHRYNAFLLRVAGFKGNREYGLTLLKATGGWQQETNSSYYERAALRGRSGLRQLFCDVVISIFQVVVSGFLMNPSYDLTTAVKISNFLVTRYEHSIIFLYISGVTQMVSSNIDAAISIFEFATHTRQEWRQILHCSCWYLFLCYCIVLDWEKALNSINILAMESMWSKATYCYHRAVAMYILGDKVNSNEVIIAMADINRQVYRFGRKCLPIEKFVARKARKFFAQGNRLFLPMFELMYIWNCYNYMNMSQMINCLTSISMDLANLELLEKTVTHIDVTEQCLSPNRRPHGKTQYPSKSMSNAAPSSSVGSINPNSMEYANYWDDYCLGYMLKGVIASKLAFYESCSASYPHEEYVKLALTCFDTVINHSSKIALDHYIFYFTRFERARMRMYLGELQEARRELDALISESTRPLEKGHYSFRSILIIQIEHILEDLKRAEDSLANKTRNDHPTTPEHDLPESIAIVPHTQERSSSIGNNIHSTNNNCIEFFRELKRKREISAVNILDHNLICEKYVAYERSYMGV
ncbi:uncharacterized protein VTP21DRAFT_2913 [Calcarisporiella thermophila]|uniref:uncharacterized protein n=1 Tax=Calcarisporiella thermophila TaxID=911321 RepID=UPI00374239C5